MPDGEYDLNDVVADARATCPGRYTTTEILLAVRCEHMRRQVWLAHPRIVEAERSADHAASVALSLQAKLERTSNGV